MKKFKLGEMVYVVSGEFCFNGRKEYTFNDEIFQDYFLEGTFRYYHAITIIAPASDGAYLTDIGIIEIMNGAYFIRTVLSSEKCLVHLEIVSAKQKLDCEKDNWYSKKEVSTRR